MSLSEILCVGHKMRNLYAALSEIAVPEAPLAPVPSEILDQFVREGPLTPEELDAAVRRFTKAIIERALGGELSHHLGYAPGAPKPDDTTNHRNGTSGKTVLTDDGPLPIAVPRDREGTFEPRLSGKHDRRFTQPTRLIVLAKGKRRRNEPDRINHVPHTEIPTLPETLKDQETPDLL